MKAITEDPDSAGGLLVSLANKMDDYIDNMVDNVPIEVGSTVSTKGELPSQQKSWQTRIDSLNKSITDYELRLTMQQQTLYTQYTTMENYISKMNTQSSWLASVTSSLSSMSNSSDS